MNDNQRYKEAEKMLREKGFSFEEMLFVRNAFADCDWESDPNVKQDFKSKEPCWRSVIHNGFLWDTKEQVQLFNLLMSMKPDARKDKMSTLISIIYKLLDIETEWRFTV